MSYETVTTIDSPLPRDSAGSVSTAEEGNKKTEYPPLHRAHQLSKVEHALKLAEAGLLVFPLYGISDGVCECREKAACQKPGKHPRVREWREKASNLPQAIRAWWGKLGWTNSNIGVLTGSRSNLAVIDIDGSEGAASFSALCQQNDWHPATRTVQTGRGNHLFFRMPSSDLRNSVGKVGVGIDVRTEGGYVVGEGSTHVSGVDYMRAASCPNDLQDFPAFLRNLVDTAGNSNGMQSFTLGVRGPDSVIEQGTRNERLFRYGCSMRGNGESFSAIFTALMSTNDLLCSPPLPESEVRSIASSAATYEPNARRRTPLPWMKDYFQDRSQDYRWQNLRDYQRGWYIELKDYAYKHYGLLPACRKQLFKLANADSRRKKAFNDEIGDVLYDFVEVVGSDGKPMLFSARLAERRDEVDHKRDLASEAGKASAVARKLRAFEMPVEASGV